MTNEKRTQAVSNALQKRIRTFSRIEKAFLCYDYYYGNYHGSEHYLPAKP